MTFCQETKCLLDESSTSATRKFNETQFYYASAFFKKILSHFIFSFSHYF